MQLMIRAFATIIVAGWCCALSGCGIEFVGDAAEAPILNQCVTDDECGASLQCLDGMCVSGVGIDDLRQVFDAEATSGDPNASRPELWLEVSVDEPVGMVVGLERFEPQQSGAITLSDALPVIGTLRYNGQRVPAKIVIRETHGEDEPDWRSVESKTQTDNSYGSIVEGANFAFAAVRGTTYEILISPTADAIGEATASARAELPPLQINSVSFGNDLTGVVDFKVDYPQFNEPCSGDKRNGCIINGRVVVTSDGNIFSLFGSGASVVAIDADTGDVVSSYATATMDGSFSLKIASHAERYYLQAVPAADARFFPASIIDPQSLVSDLAGVLQVTVERVEPIHYKATVLAENGSAVPGANVRLRALRTGNVSLSAVDALTATALTSSVESTLGEFEFDLYPGVYELSITPPNDSTLAQKKQVVLITSDSTSQGAKLVLRDQVRFSAQLQTFRSEFGASVDVQFTARPDESGTISNRSTQATSDSAGFVEALVDPGTFDISLRPRGSSNLGWRVFADYVIGKDGTTELVLPAPVVIDGEVKDSIGSSVSGATVRLYRNRIDGGTDDGLLIGSTATAADGTYRMLVSPY
ncbi:MAG: hypothetical protein R3A47_10080 [Polyangiales bacterium]